MSGRKSCGAVAAHSRELRPGREAFSGLIVFKLQIAVAINSSMGGGGATAARGACTGLPLATSIKTSLTVSSVRVDGTCNFLVARITVDARRNRFTIFSPASNTSVDRMISLDV